MTGDVRADGALEAAVLQAESRFGGLDAAIAVAGVIAGGKPPWLVPVDQERGYCSTAAYDAAATS